MPRKHVIDLTRGPVASQTKPRIARQHREWVVKPMYRFGWDQQKQYLAAKAWCVAQNAKESINGRNH